MSLIKPKLALFVVTLLLSTKGNASRPIVIINSSASDISYTCVKNSSTDTLEGTTSSIVTTACDVILDGLTVISYDGITVLSSSYYSADECSSSETVMCVYVEDDESDSPFVDSVSCAEIACGIPIPDPIY